MSRDRIIGSSWDRSPGLQALLEGHDPRAILFRLTDGDPLDLVERCIDMMRERAALLDSQRVVMASAARIAYFGTHYEGNPPPERWISEQVDGEIGELVDEDARDHLDGVALDPDDPRYANLARSIGVAVEDLRVGCVVFQRLPFQDRAAFWAVLVDGKSVELIAFELGVSAKEIKRRYDRAVTAFCSLGTQHGPEEHDPPDRERDRL